jgi:hypothetical protein
MSRSVQGLLGDHLLQPRVFPLELLQALSLIGLHPAVLVPPPVPRRLGDLQMLEHPRQFGTSAELPLALPQLADDLLRRMPPAFLTHRR